MDYRFSILPEDSQIMESHDEVQLEFSQITSQIYIGCDYCCPTHFNEQLESTGITADLCLDGECEGGSPKLKYSLHLGVLDDEAPTPTQLKLGVYFLDLMVKSGEKIYVHSGKGHGRAPTIVAAYFISVGMEVDEAVEKIKASRPEAHLVLPQIEALRSFAKKVG